MAITEKWMSIMNRLVPTVGFGGDEDPKKPPVPPQTSTTPPILGAVPPPIDGSMAGAPTPGDGVTPINFSTPSYTEGVEAARQQQLADQPPPIQPVRVIPPPASMGETSGAPVTNQNVLNPTPSYTETRTPQTYNPDTPAWDGTDPGIGAKKAPGFIRHTVDNKGKLVKLKTPIDAAQRINAIQGMVRGKPTPISEKQRETETPGLATQVLPQSLTKLKLPNSFVYNNANVGVIDRDGRKVVVDEYGNAVGDLASMAGKTLKGQQVAVLGNNIVDLKGNVIATVAQAEAADRDFRFANRMDQLQKLREKATAENDSAALVRLDEMEAREKLTYAQNRPKDTTRSWGDIFKGIGLGALQGLATGKGIGGMIGGAAAGGVGTAISPEFRQQMQDQMYRLPQAEADYKQAVGFRKANDDAENDNIANLAKEEDLRQSIIRGRGLAVDNSQTWKSLIQFPRPMEESDIRAIEAETGMAIPGLRPGMSAKQQLDWYNGQLGVWSGGNTVRPVGMVNSDGTAIPVVDPTKLPVTVIGPQGQRYSVTSEDEAKRLGTWALEQYRQGQTWGRFNTSQQNIQSRFNAKEQRLKEGRSNNSATLDKISRAQGDIDKLDTQIKVKDLEIENAKNNIKRMPEEQKKLPENAVTVQSWQDAIAKLTVERDGLQAQKKRHEENIKRWEKGGTDAEDAQIEEDDSEDN